MRPVLLTQFDEFFALAAEREKAGVDEYRNGDAAAPFAGDALRCKLEEHADALNYLHHAARAAGHPEAHREWPEHWQGERIRIIESAMWTMRRLRHRDAVPIVAECRA